MKKFIKEYWFKILILIFIIGFSVNYIIEKVQTKIIDNCITEIITILNEESEKKYILASSDMNDFKNFCKISKTES